MNTSIKKSIFLGVTVSVFFFTLYAAHATTPTVLTLTPTTGDAIQLSVSGTENSTIQLSFLPAGAPVLTTIVLGTTDSSGHFSTSISSGGYGIPSTSPVFASINGLQSTMALWPSYTSALSLSQTSAHIAIGQSVTVNGSTALILAANSQSSAVSTSISGSQITLTGVSSGSATVTVCGANVGCGSLAVQVGGGTDQNEISFTPSNPVLRTQQSISVSIFGGGTNGYTIKSNSQPTVIDPSFGGAHDILYIFGKAFGQSTVTICSVQYSTDCASLAVTVLGNSSAALSFTPNNLILIPGLTQGSTISGGSGSGYYISSNSTPGVAQANVSGSTITVVGGTSVGSTIITVCSTTVNNTCGDLNVVLNNNASSYSTTTLTFSQNIVSIPLDETSTVTVNGGNNTGYSISSNSNSTVVTASINGTSNVVNLHGNALGSAIVTVCSTSSSTTCASAYITVGPALSPIILSDTMVSLAPAEKKMIAIAHGDIHTTIYSNTNPAVISTFLSQTGDAMVLTGGATSGTSVITVCPTDVFSSKCSTVSASVHATTASAPPTLVAPLSPALSPSTPRAMLLRADGDTKVYVIKDGKREWIQTEKAFMNAGYQWGDIVVTTPAALAAYPEMTVAAAQRVKVFGTAELHVRQSYNAKSKSVGKAKNNETFTVLKESKGWYEIKTPAGVIGWISGAYARKQ